MITCCKHIKWQWHWSPWKVQTVWKNMFWTASNDEFTVACAEIGNLAQINLGGLPPATVFFSWPASMDCSQISCEKEARCNIGPLLLLKNQRPSMLHTYSYSHDMFPFPSLYWSPLDKDWTMTVIPLNGHPYSKEVLHKPCKAGLSAVVRCIHSIAVFYTGRSICINSTAIWSQITYWKKSGMVHWYGSLIHGLDLWLVYQPLFI